MTRTRYLVLALVLVAWLPSRSASAEVYTLDRIVAVVDQTPIMLSSLRERVLPAVARMLRETTNIGEQIIKKARLFSDGLNGLVDDQLIREQARKERIEVAPHELQEAVESIAKKNDLDVAQLYAEVRAIGYKKGQYQQRVELEILEGRLLKTQLSSWATIITEEQLRKLFAELQAAEPGQFQSYEESRAVLVDRLRERRFTAARERWLKGLRLITHIELRLGL